MPVQLLQSRYPQPISSRFLPRLSFGEDLKTDTFNSAVGYQSQLRTAIREGDVARYKQLTKRQIPTLDIVPKGWKISGPPTKLNNIFVLKLEPVDSPVSTHNPKQLHIPILSPTVVMKLYESDNAESYGETVNVDLSDLEAYPDSDILNEHLSLKGLALNPTNKEFSRKTIIHGTLDRKWLEIFQALADILPRNTSPDAKMIWQFPQPNGHQHVIQASRNQNMLYLTYQDNEEHLRDEDGEPLTNANIYQELQLDLKTGQFERKGLLQIEGGEILLFPQYQTNPIFKHPFFEMMKDLVACLTSLNEEVHCSGRKGKPDAYYGPLLRTRIPGQRESIQSLKYGLTLPQLQLLEKLTLTLEHQESFWEKWVDRAKTTLDSLWQRMGA